MKMKKWMLYIIPLFLALAACDNKKERETDWDIYNLHGEVKSLKQTEYGVKFVGDSISKGAKSHWNWTNFSMDFNREGMLTQQLMYDKDGGVLSRTECHVDERGLVVEESEFGGNDELISVKKLTYNKRDFLIETVTYYALDSLQEHHVYNYNDKRKLDAVDCYGADGALESRQVYSYNEAGEISQLTIIDEKTGQETIYYKTYTPEGLLSEVRMCLHGQCATFFYNAHGDEEREIYFDGTEGDSFQYEYDEKNNWIQRTTFANGKPQYIVERVIEYYQEPSME